MFRSSRRFFSSISKPITDYTPYLSRQARRRRPSAIRKLVPLMERPGMISLGGGNPNADTFPISHINVYMKNGKCVPVSVERTLLSLQYSNSFGLDSLVAWLESHQQRYHSRASRDWSLCVTTGSQDALDKAFGLLLDEGDRILVESPTYSGALASLAGAGAHCVPIKKPLSVELAPEHIERTMESMREEERPKILYTIPNGQNPSGDTLSLECRQGIYEVCRKYDMLILEDDPYMHLALGGAKVPPSLWSMDTDGRVMRFDSLSKVVSSGVRIGWVTGPRPLVDIIQLDQQASCLHVCGVSQAILLSIVDEWGWDGFEKHLEEVRILYTLRRDAFLSYCDKHLKGLAKWRVPVAGMFVWFEIPGVDDTRELIEKDAVENGVLLVPGAAFIPGDNSKSPFVRASFSTASFDQMEEAVIRFATVLARRQKSPYQRYGKVNK